MLRFCNRSIFIRVYHRLKYHVNDVRKDMGDFTAIPKVGETDAEALIRLLEAKKCRYIYLYTNVPEDKSTSRLEMKNSDQEHVSVTQGDMLQGVRGWICHVASKISAFFDDAWALPSHNDFWRWQRCETIEHHNVCYLPSIHDSRAKAGSGKRQAHHGVPHGNAHDGSGR